MGEGTSSKGAKPKPEPSTTKRRERDPPKGRNKVRDMLAGAMSAVALTILVLGVLRPWLDDDVPFRALESFGAAIVSIALWTLAAYVHLTTEKE